MLALVLLLICEASFGFFFVPEYQSDSYSWYCRKSVSSRKNCRWLEDADQLPVWIVAINSAKACSRISPTCFSAAIQDRMLCER
uniref:Putative secreted protein n=1 Tax=Ixodes scapularis TaxID=6945 RepID=A0A4D5S6C3_IXOSC